MVKVVIWSFVKIDLRTRNNINEHEEDFNEHEEDFNEHEEDFNEHESH